MSASLTLDDPPLPAQVDMVVGRRHRPSIALTQAGASLLTVLALVSPGAAFRMHTALSRGARWASRGAHVRAGLMRMSASARPTAAGESVDARLITEKPDLVIAHLKARRATEEQLSSVKDIAALNLRRKELVKEQQAALATRKSLSAEIGKLMREQRADEAERLKVHVEEANKVAAAAEEQLVQLEGDMEAMVRVVPNLLDDRVPDGANDSQNVVVREWGTELRKVGEGFLWHDDVAAKLNGYEPVAAAKISGSRFSVLKGQVARLERAITQFLLDQHTLKNGYTEVTVPLIVSRSSLIGTGQLPKFELDLFAVNHKANGEDAFLIPTAEVPVTNLHRDEILDSAHLPLSYVALTPCFRAEAGSYGRDTKGLMRQHQFHKVELVKITTPESSDAEHEALTQHAEACLEALKLPYRRVRLCSGDIGFSAKHCYDLEVWLPGQQAYREISSCSNCGDFQARRMGLRYRPLPLGAKGEKGRTLLAVLENYQEPDGSVTVPEILVSYMGGLERVEPPQKR